MDKKTSPFVAVVVANQEVKHIPIEQDKWASVLALLSQANATTIVLRPAKVTCKTNKDEKRAAYLQQLLEYAPTCITITQQKQCMMKLVRLAPKAKADKVLLEIVDWEQERKNGVETRKQWHDLFSDEKQQLSVKPVLTALLEQQHATSGPQALLNKTAIQRWRLDLGSKRGNSVIYCMVVWDTVRGKWMLYVGQAATLKSRFQTSAKSGSHTAAMRFAMTHCLYPELLLDMGLQLVDLCAAASCAVAKKPVYLFVLEATAPAQLDAREGYWMNQLKSRDPDIGLNIQPPRTSKPKPSKR